MSSWAPTKYKTTNWPAYNDSLKRRGSLSILDRQHIRRMCERGGLIRRWLDTTPMGNHGRQQQFSDVAIQTCLTLKALFGMPLRETTGFVQGLLRLVGLDWAEPDFITLCRPLPGRRFASQICPEGSEDLGRKHPLARLQGAAAPADPLSSLPAATAGQWTVPASKSRAKARGTPASMAVPNGGSTDRQGIAQQCPERVAQDPPWDRRGNAGGSGRGDHREPHRRCPGFTRPAQPDPGARADRQRHRRRSLRPGASPVQG